MLSKRRLIKFRGDRVKRKRRTEIILETNQTVVIRGQRKKTHAQCPECGRAVPTVTLEEAAALTGLSIRAIYQRVDARSIHSFEGATDTLLVCLNSLVNDQRI